MSYYNNSGNSPFNNIGGIGGGVGGNAPYNEQNEIQKYEKQIEEANLPREAYEAATKELKRLK